MYFESSQNSQIHIVRKMQRSQPACTHAQINLASSNLESMLEMKLLGKVIKGKAKHDYYINCGMIHISQVPESLLMQKDKIER